MTDQSMMSTTDLIAALRRREVSSRELLEMYVDRITADAGTINAVVTLDEERARTAAAAADEALAKGSEVGPLCGLPMTIKDALETAGLRTTCGVPEFADHVPVRDADAVARLRAAGAVIFGKTNTPMYAADFQTANPLFGVTNNPWDLARTPGGSAGGSAAALAAGHTGLELGSDIAGSIRQPAANCGVFGLRPSHGLVPTRGHIPGPPGELAEPEAATIGPLGRSAEDLELALSVLAGPNRARSKAWRVQLPNPRHTSLSDYRIACCLTEPHRPVDDEVAEVLTDAVDGLRVTGARIEQVALPVPLAESEPLFLQMLAGVVAADQPDEAMTFLRSVAAGAPAADNSSMVQWARGITQSVVQWQRLLEARAHIKERWAAFFARYDVLLCPVTVVAPIRHDLDLDPAMRTIEINGTAAPYLDAQFGWPGLATLADLPAVSAPAGLTKSGLPIGLQVVGPYLEDRTAIDVARHIEALVGRRRLLVSP